MIALVSWLNRLYAKYGCRRSSPTPAQRRGTALRVEVLEDRCVPSSSPRLVADLFPGNLSGFPGNLTGVNEHLFFSVRDSSTLWQSDGTSAGTTLLKDINPGVQSNLQHLTNVNGTLFFTANDGNTGYELWKSDGTSSGTALLKDIRPGAAWSNPGELTNVNGALFFIANDGSHGYELWRSDGTSAGTTLVRDIYPGADWSDPGQLTNVGGTLFLVAIGDGLELWKSDGTSAGTTQVKDIRPGAANGSDPVSLTNVSGTLFFIADDGSTGRELWKSDGTPTGTSRVKDIYPGGLSSHLDSLTNVNGALFFRANDGSHGFELWKSDGSSAGTTLVKDINPGAGDSSISSLTNVNGGLFFAAVDGIAGKELWKSDGTSTGTALVKDIRPGANYANPGSLTNVNGTLFFRAHDGSHGHELWKSDGTSAGTTLVKDIYPGASSSYPSYLTNVNGALFFRANDGVHGAELWVADALPRGSLAGDGLPYVLDQALNLRFTGSYSQDYGGANEKWVLGDDGWYFIKPNGELWKWDNVANSATGKLIAHLAPFFWEHPGRLHDTTAREPLPLILDQTLNLRLSGSYSQDYGGANEKWALGDDGWYFIKPTGELFRWDGTANAATGALIAVLDPLFWEQPALLHDRAQASTLDQTLNLRFEGSYSQDYGGANEKWALGDDGWYFIKPDGTFYQWDGAANSATGTLLAALAPLFWQQPALLHDTVEQTLPVLLDQALNLRLSGSYSQDYGGANEKWALGDDGWYFIKPGGELFRWDGTANAATGTLVAHLAPVFWEQPGLLHEALPLSLPEVLDQSLQLSFTGSYSQNYGGANEKWLLGANNTWYFIKPNGELWRWDGTANAATGMLLALLDPFFWENPEELWNPRS
jgi:ELWxxDGT repeat protein